MNSFMDLRVSLRPLFRAILLSACIAASCLVATGQTTSVCNAVASTPSQVAANGLAEQIGNIVITCSNGNVGSNVIANVYITLSTDITNTLDSNGLPENIAVTSQVAPVTNDTPFLSSANTLEITNLTYTVPDPNSLPVTITISGIRAAVAAVQNAQSGTVVNASVVAIGMTLPSLQIPIAIASGSQLSASVQNNGVPCTIVTPTSTDFNGFVNSGVASSAIRVTETTATSFAPKAVGATNGTRLVVTFSGYGSSAQLWVPSALVGNSGSIPTTAGEFGSTIGGGTYTPNANQLLLTLVTGADQNGVGGTFVTSLPAGGTTFTGLTQLTVSNGTAYAVYEVLDGSPYVEESVQIPVFVLSSSSNCSQSVQPTLNVVEGPVSTVATATATDPIPRYTSVSLTSDCQQVGDCNLGYFPVLSVASTQINLTGNAQGLAQTAAVSVLNNGGSLMTYSTSVTYQSGAGWLSLNPSSGDVSSGVSLSVIADPTLLQPGTYSATVNLNAGEAGTASIPVTFTVGAAGPTIRGIVNAASFQAGITPGSYVALFGSLLNGQNVSVTFNNQPAQVIYDSAGQINLIIPSSLTPQSGASVVAMINGQVSNTFTVTLAANAPGIFTPGILNADSTVNSASNPASRGAFVQVYLTGLTLPENSTLTVTMGGQSNIAPLPGQTYGTVLPALDQVNVTIPSSLSFSGNSAPLSICLSPLPGAPASCSNPVTLYVH
jgi:uncharacterized protein (TIGR03437 family)